MNAFEKFIAFIKFETTATQAPFTPYHIVMFSLFIAVTVILCIKAKDCTDKTFRKIIFIIWAVLFVFEIYKQLTAPFSVVDGKAKWDYNFNDIPYQFCSSIHYTLLPIVFLKDGKVRDACISYLATFGLFAGAIVMILPTTVLGERIGNNIQTMYHHSTMVVIGVLLLVVNRKKLDFKFLYTAMIVFCVCLLIALALNIIMHFALPETEESFNMFYVGPYESCDLPILSAIQPHVHPIVFILIYAIGFCIVSTIVFYIAKLVLYIKAKAQNK